MLIGLKGVARSGKDTVADYLVEKYGFKKWAFADLVREFCEAQDPILCASDGEVLPLKRVLQITEGWEGAKTYSKWKDPIRRLLQITGTEAGRNVLGENIWVNATFNKMKAFALENPDYKGHVIKDVRFENEGEAIVRQGGFVVRLERDGLEEVGIKGHASEAVGWRLPRGELLLRNNKDLKSLYHRIDNLCTTLTL